jgi:cytochrome P450
MQLADELVSRVRVGHDSTAYVARLINRFDESGCSDKQVLLDLVVISIFGGVDTTKSQLGNAMALFAKHPDQWQALRTDRSLIPAAIDESLRHKPTTTWVTREVLTEFEFDGVSFEAGQTVHILVHSTALDPQVTSTSDFDITASRKPHLGFGGGAHHCLGHIMARTDMGCALDVLADRFRTFELVGDADWLPDSGNTGPLSLPLKFTGC